MWNSRTRKKQILKVVVEDYVRTAEPVGHAQAMPPAEDGGVSSATIRNELSDLTELGYLEQPHTSAGRVPSPKGYRLYVNELMERQRLSIAETERINQSLQTKMEELDRVICPGGPGGELPDELPRLCGHPGEKADDRPAVRSAAGG